MNWLREQTLSTKINTLILGTLLTLSTIMVILMHGITSDIMERQVELRGYEIANYIAASGTNDILQENDYALFDLIKKVKDNNEDVRYILIIDYSGKIIGSTFEQGLPKGLPPYIPTDHIIKQQIMKYNSSEGTIYEVVVPLENGNVGSIRVGMSNKIMYNLLAVTLTEFSLTIFALAFTAVILTGWLTSIIIRPIIDLAKAAEEIKNNNYDVQTDYDTNDEVGDLAKTFNEMALSLDQKEKENNKLLEALRIKEMNRTVLLNKIFTAQEDERKRISRELHDGAGQSITSLLAYLRILLAKTPDPSQQSLILAARDVIVNVLGELKQLAVDLRPPAIDDLGLISAMEKYIHGLTVAHNYIYFNVSLPKDDFEFPDTITSALYRILQESTTNIIRHAKATNIDIILTKNTTEVKLIVKDNGRGFSKSTLEKAQKNNHLGVYGMKERIELLKGEFNIKSKVGIGTTITIIIPLKLE